MSQKHSPATHGFTLIETIVAIGVLGIFFSAVVLILQMILENIAISRLRATALALAQQKIELIRNLSYTNVGTSGGIPAGPIPQNEIVTINTLPFLVTTSILYIDDPFDGSAPTDLIPSDYKRVRVEITWEGSFPSRAPVSLVTNISPKGIETIVGGGTLMIQVFNSSGLPVPNATVQIDNTVVTPNIHMQTLSSADGYVAIPGAPACITCYKITVSKTNYSTNKTYSTSEVANPLQPDASVIEGSVTPLSFSIDEVSLIVVNSYNSVGSPVANVQFTLVGTKIIGYDTDDNPVVKYRYTTNTGGSTVQIPGLEWDNYTLDFTDSGHTLAGSTPTMPFLLPAKTNLTIPIIVVPKASSSLLVIVKDTAGILQSSASATLANIPLGYGTTKFTNATGSADYGQVFFASLSPAIYNLTVSLPGYTDATASINISANQQEPITLNPLL